MRLPRDVSGSDLARRLERYGYRVTRQVGSHMRLTSAYTGREHRITIPAHHDIRVGTLAAILRDVAGYLDIDLDALVRELFNG